MIKEIKKEKENFNKEQVKKENSLNAMIGVTLARHSGLSEEEYKKAIGLEKSDLPEDELIRIALFNLRLEKTKIIIHATQVMRLCNEKLIMTLLNQEQFEELKKKEEEYDKEKYYE